MSKNLKSAFTLIELLVVIAIIGILSGIIIVTMSNSTESARIAKLQVFSNSARDSLGANLVGEWKLDSIIGSSAPYTTLDTWSGNTGTLGDGTTATTFPNLITTEASCALGKCFSFDGGDYVTGTLSGVSTTKRWTVSIWLKTSASTNSLYDTRTSGVSGCLFVEDSLNTWRLQLVSPAGTVKNYSYTLSLSDNVWHFLVATRNGDNAIDLYFDSSLQTPASKPTDLDITSLSETWSNFSIGSNYAHNAFFTGNIDEVRMYNAVVSAFQIREQYLAGLNNLLTNGEMSRQEYNQRVAKLYNYCALENRQVD